MEHHDTSECGKLSIFVALIGQYYKSYLLGSGACGDSSTVSCFQADTAVSYLSFQRDESHSKMLLQ